jgi:uroporphyrinogen III methyltransferase/synthase
MDFPKGLDVAGKVVFVGAGPGHPDLMTVRARHWLRQADVIVHDALVPRELLATVNPAADLIPVPRDAAPGADPGTAVGDLLASLAGSGRTIIRLKGGDPTVFARLAEELLPVRTAGIAVEIVPGVTAALAAAAAAGIPTTSRSAASSVVLVTGHEADRKESAIDYPSLAKLTGTIAIYMGVDQAEAWSRSLIDTGMPGDTPVTIVSRCSWPDETIAVTTLTRCAADFASNAWRAPAVAIVGEVAHGAAAAPAAGGPLSGRRVIVTRPAGQEAHLADLVSRAGAVPIHVPTVRIEAPASWAPLDAAIAIADTFDWIVFSSANGVRAFLTRLRALGRDGRSLGTARLAAVGPATARTLDEAGYVCDLVPETFHAEALADRLATAAPGMRLLLVQADKGRDVLARRLAAAGHEVVEAEAYRSSAVESLDAATAGMLAVCPIDWIVVTSPAIAKAALALFGERMRHWKTASISPLTSAALREAGCPVTAEAATATADGIVAAMADWEAIHAGQAAQTKHFPQAERTVPDAIP